LKQVCCVLRKDKDRQTDGSNNIERTTTTTTTITTQTQTPTCCDKDDAAIQTRCYCFTEQLDSLLHEKIESYELLLGCTPPLAQQ